MKLRRDGCIACNLALLLLAAPVVAGEDSLSPEVIPPQVQGVETAKHSSVPEPNTMLFAGIGGFILLIFAIRRK